MLTCPSQTASNDERYMTLGLHPCQPFDKCGDASHSFRIPQSFSQHPYDARLERTRNLSTYYHLHSPDNIGYFFDMQALYVPENELLIIARNVRLFTSDEA